jgi:HDOD domain
MKAWLPSFFTHRAPTAVALPLPAERRVAPFVLTELSANGWQLRRPVFDGALLVWMLQVAADPSDNLGACEKRVLQALEMRATATAASLLPRAAGVVPALLARLRSDKSSLREPVEHVSRDQAQVAEVVAMANSASYRRAQPGP